MRSCAASFSVSSTAAASLAMAFWLVRMSCEMSEMVLVEVLSSLSDGGPLRQAVGDMIQKLRNNLAVIIVPQTSEQFESALRRYKQVADKSWSLTDCASFEVMEAEQIQAALTHDQHFAQAGFEALFR
jgi:predicted nucleic acid-binding protein